MTDTTDTTDTITPATPTLERAVRKPLTFYSALDQKWVFIANTLLLIVCALWLYSGPDSFLADMPKDMITVHFDCTLIGAAIWAVAEGKELRTTHAYKLAVTSAVVIILILVAMAITLGWAFISRMMA